MRFLFVFFLTALLSFPVAAASDTAARETGEVAPSTLGDGKTALVVDPTDGTVRVLIDGQEKLRIDAAGLHVQGDVSYSGMISDSGDSAAEPAQKGEGHAP